jgi:cytochrome b subunit of formate dehydrogenase
MTSRRLLRMVVCGGLALVAGALVAGAQAEAPEKIGSEDCVTCHEESSHKTKIAEDLSHSSHEGLECLDCHQHSGTVPHDVPATFVTGHDACATCHEEAAQQYKSHGREVVGSNTDLPKCSDCHGDHDILPSNVKHARTHPSNLPQTCGRCHANLDLIKKYEMLLKNPLDVYASSVHGKATTGGVYVAATCNDCHSTGGSAHRILSPNVADSSINHFNIPFTCGKCHKGVESDFWEGVHGKLVKRGETDAPVCTNCHGEHGILSPSDPRSPVARAHLAEQTCSPCHESAVLNEKYGIPTGRLTTFVDSYHGLKTKAGDARVANCASCHGAHRILPSSDPTSTINAANLQTTCGECHPKISAKLAATSIHGVSGEGLRTPLADVIEKVYIVAIVVIIGLMVLHWLIDLGRQLIHVVRQRPQIRRMQPGEVWQHLLLSITFVVLVVSGFSLRFDQSWVSRLFFGWEGGFELRGVIHRVAAVLFMGTVAWHIAFMLTPRGRGFVRDMLPEWLDFNYFWSRIMYNLGRRAHTPCIQRFSYVEKAEYWALVWGTGVMMVTGLLLWFDNWFIQILPKGTLDVALVIHYWEAWLATLAILIWHMYSVVFNPHVYPMNPSWLTGTMPEGMYKHEHPGHLETAKRESEEYARRAAAILEADPTQHSEDDDVEKPRE